MMEDSFKNLTSADANRLQTPPSGLNATSASPPDIDCVPKDKKNTVSVEKDTCLRVDESMLSNMSSLRPPFALLLDLSMKKSQCFSVPYKAFIAKKGRRGPKKGTKYGIGNAKGYGSVKHSCSGVVGKKKHVPKKYQVPKKDVNGNILMSSLSSSSCTVTKGIKTNRLSGEQKMKASSVDETLKMFSAKPTCARVRIDPMQSKAVEVDKESSRTDGRTAVRTKKSMLEMLKRRKEANGKKKNDPIDSVNNGAVDLRYCIVNKNGPTERRWNEWRRKNEEFEKEQLEARCAIAQQRKEATVTPPTYAQWKFNESMKYCTYTTKRVAKTDLSAEFREPEAPPPVILDPLGPTVPSTEIDDGVLLCL